MRLWHKDLIPVLPDKQLRGQWRECCLIAKLLSEDKLNHLLVNKIKQYPDDDFNSYAMTVYYEMLDRGFKANYSKFFKWREEEHWFKCIDDIFQEWHDDSYLKQCYFNLEEKYHCGGIDYDEFMNIVNLLDHLEYDFMYED